jgi:substrate import-associated zinc metallohydrolase lipoprotein
MKNIRIFLLAVVAAVTLWSCSEEKLNSESVLEQPDYSNYTAFDYWLLYNYTYPYNIDFMYKMKDVESSIDHELVPANIPNSIAMAKLVKHLWIEVFDEVAGVEFSRAHMPRILVLVGSGAFNGNGSLTLATASQGVKITLYEVNGVNPLSLTTQYLKDRYLGTLYHEFTHILNAKKAFDPEFAAISNGDYVGSTWNTSGGTTVANQLGFTTAYSRSSEYEDFVNILAHYVVQGQAGWDAMITNAGGPTSAGGEKLNRKLEIVRGYFRVSWGVNIADIRRVFEEHLATMYDLDLVNP